ncbi:hypothetical protein GCM10010388_21230 [Streptomyces mauvecolor]
MLGVATALALREGVPGAAASPARCVPHPATSVPSTAMGSIPNRTALASTIAVPPILPAPRRGPCVFPE